LVLLEIHEETRLVPHNQLKRKQARDCALNSNLPFEGERHVSLS
jgi:hypothetical protein